MLVLWSSVPITAVLDTVYSCELYTVCFHCWAKHTDFQTYFTKPKATNSIIFLLRSWIHGFYCWLYHDIWAFAVAFRPQAQACGHHTCSIKSLHEACNTFCNWHYKKMVMCFNICVQLWICPCGGTPNYLYLFVHILLHCMSVCFLIKKTYGFDSINGISIWFLQNWRSVSFICFSN